MRTPGSKTGWTSLSVGAAAAPLLSHRVQLAGGQLGGLLLRELAASPDPLRCGKSEEATKCGVHDLVLAVAGAGSEHAGGPKDILFEIRGGFAPSNSQISPNCGVGVKPAVGGTSRSVGTKSSPESEPG